MGSGVPLGPNVLLTVAGRHSGKPYTFPVALLEVDGRMFVQSPFGDVNWVRNLRTAREAVLTRAGRQTEVGASELAPEDAAPVPRRALAPYTRSRLSAAVLGRFFRLRPDATPEEYVDEARRHPMFELRPRDDR